MQKLWKWLQRWFEYQKTVRAVHKAASKGSCAYRTEQEITRQ